MDTQISAEETPREERRGKKIWRWLAVGLGVLIGQCILYGPSLVGSKILLPLDVLAMPQTYLPDTPQTPNGYPHDLAAQDLVLEFEPYRLFAARELKAGRFPFWTPYQYGGVPFSWPMYSPLHFFTALTESPALIPWAQLLAALIAGTGAYAFCRRVLGVGFWPATVAAWCYPLTGFFVLWQGSLTGAAVYWLPWLLLAVDRTVRGNRVAAATLAIVTGLTLVSGHVDVAGQVLLVSGLYALWCLRDVYGLQLFRARAAKAVGLLALGWGLGFLLAAPYVLPLMEYVATGARVEERSEGFEARRPTGLTALPQTVLPDMYGSTQRGQAPLLASMPNLPESAAATYTGLVATLAVAPWAWYSRRHRSLNVFWTLLGGLGLSWCLNLPGLVDLLRLPGLNFMSHNRLVFATSFAVLAMTAIGLEALSKGWIRPRWQLWLQCALLIGLLGWCLYRTRVLPPLLAARLEEVVRNGKEVFWIKNLGDVHRAQLSFLWRYQVSAAWCVAGLILWLMARLGLLKQPVLARFAGVLLLGDLLWFSYGRNVQCDRSLYYPEIPALRDVAGVVSGRILGYNALPADLAQVVGLKDVRGYDSVDPARWLRLLQLAPHGASPNREYARVQWFVPIVKIDPTNSVRLSPVLNMLGVQYLILRGAPHPGLTPAFQSPDYWVLENRSALPRAFVPRHVELVPDGNETLYRLGRPEFDPRQVAYVERAAGLSAESHGTATIAEEIPGRVAVTARMETPGLLVLADAWNKGWRAYVDGRRAPILRTNFDLRGVVLPAGSHRVEFRYEPGSVTLAFWLAGAAAVFLLAWLGVVSWTRWKARTAMPTI